MAKFENYKLSTCFTSIQLSRRSKRFFSFRSIFSHPSQTAVIPTHFISFSIQLQLRLFSLMLHHLQNGKLITHPQITLASTIRNLFVAAAVTIVASLLRGFVNNARRITLQAKSKQNGEVRKEEREKERVLQLNASMHTDTHCRICSIYMHRNTM